MGTSMGTLERSVQMPPIAESLTFSIAVREEPGPATLTEGVDGSVETLGSTIRGIEMLLLSSV